MTIEFHFQCFEMQLYIFLFLNLRVSLLLSISDLAYSITAPYNEQSKPNPTDFAPKSRNPEALTDLPLNIAGYGFKNYDGKNL